MHRRGFFTILAFVTAAALSGCDTVTDLSEVSAEGRWDSAGALQSVTLFINPESPDGTFNGTWRQGDRSAAITDGKNENGVITFKLQGFNGGAVDFSGEFTNQYRLAGDLQGMSLGGDAVFRRTSF
jgi:hypothetical protein